MDKTALQWAIAANLLSTYGGDRREAWEAAGEIADQVEQDPHAAGEIFVNVPSHALDVRLNRIDSSRERRYGG